MAVLIVECLGLFASASFAQQPNWQECLPFPSLAQEIAEMQAESEITVQVREVYFTGVHALSQAGQEQVARMIEAETFTATSDEPDSWNPDLTKLVLDGWQRHGFYKIRIENVAVRVLSSSQQHQQVAVNVTVEEGQRYRLSSLTFRGNKLFPAERLRSVFPLHDGEIFATDKIREGLESVRKLYSLRGYINTTIVPNERRDADNPYISLDLDIDKGRQFRYGQILVIGLDASEVERLKERFGLNEGAIYNSQFLEGFAKVVMDDPSNPALSRRIIHEREGKVDLFIDARKLRVECPDWTSLERDSSP